MRLCVTTFYQLARKFALDVSLLTNTLANILGSINLELKTYDTISNG